MDDSKAQLTVHILLKDCLLNLGTVYFQKDRPLFVERPPTLLRDRSLSERPFTFAPIKISKWPVRFLAKNLNCLIEPSTFRLKTVNFTSGQSSLSQNRQFSEISFEPILPQESLLSERPFFLDSKPRNGFCFQTIRIDYPVFQ